MSANLEVKDLYRLSTIDNVIIVRGQIVRQVWTWLEICCTVMLGLKNLSISNKYLVKDAFNTNRVIALSPHVKAVQWSTE